MPFARAPASRHPTGKYRKSSRTLAGRPVVSFKLLTRRMGGGGGQHCTYRHPPSDDDGTSSKEGENLLDPVYFTRRPDAGPAPSAAALRICFLPTHTHIIIFIYTDVDFSIENHTIIDLYIEHESAR